MMSKESLSVVGVQARAAADDLLEIDHRPDRLGTSTMFLTVGRSTPVESSCDVVAITGVSVSTSAKSLEVALADVAFVARRCGPRSSGAARVRSAFALCSARRIWSACSWSTQKTIVFAHRSVRFRYSVRCLAAASVRASSETTRSKSCVVVEAGGDLAAEAVELPLVGLPAVGVRTEHDAPHPVRERGSRRRCPARASTRRSGRRSSS